VTISDRPDADAILVGIEAQSFERFDQTFVIALSLFLIIVAGDKPAFPPIPGQILALLGISGGSYVVAKGIAVSGKEPGEPPPNV
jgi:hypothetical protein